MASRKLSRALHGQRQFEIWLAEYAAANDTRAHYDSTRWLIGSIFIAASFTLFASSFLDQLSGNIIALGSVVAISIILWFVFVFYDVHVTPWIQGAIARCHKIEETMRAEGYDFWLHAWIKYKRDKSDKVNFEKKTNRVSGRWVVVFFSVMIPVVWYIRIFLIRRCL
jgi:arginyl-tRNA--protein-N-Asp/Glu arginylyltransferase